MRFFLPLLFVVAFMAGCATKGVDPAGLRAPTGLPPVEVIKPVIANHTEISGVTVRLGQGLYFPIGQNDAGVYYACPFGIVLQSGKEGQSFTRLVGGLYIPRAQTEERKVWFVISGGAAATGSLQVEPAVGSRLTQTCHGSPSDAAVASKGWFTVTVLPVGNQTASAIGLATAGGVVSSIVVNAMISANDGRYYFPPVILDAPIEMGVRASPTTTPTQSAQ